MPVFRQQRHHDEYDKSYGRRPERKERDEPLLWPHLGIMLLLGATALLTVWGIAGKTMFEKTLKELASPVGLLWLLLLFSFWISCLHRKTSSAIGFLFAWLLLTITGNQFVAHSILETIESEWRDDSTNNEPAAGSSDPFDMVVVLGGGTGITPDFEPQLASSGDRVSVAAKLFAQQKTKTICVTGEQVFRTDPADPDPAEEARDILISWGVPAESIIALRGINTDEEISHLKKWIDEKPERAGWKIGLVTSAFHMRRAMDLAKKHGVENLHPLPADWRSSPLIPSPNLIIPSAESLDSNKKALHEFLGRMISR